MSLLVRYVAKGTPEAGSGYQICRERDARGRFWLSDMPREGRQRQVLYPTEPRFRSEKSAADTKLEKTSLSAGGFLRVPYGYRTCLWLRDRPAIKLSHISL